MTWEQILLQLGMLPDLLLSILLGFAIGFERRLRSKEAGIRTHTIVCVGAALMMSSLILMELLPSKEKSEQN